MTPSKQEIIARAADCFMEQGFHATSIDDVARRLGATKGRVYHHYASKTDLFFDVHREGMRLLFEAVEPALHTPGDGLAVLRAMLTAHGLALFEHQAFETVVAQGVQLHRFAAMTPGQREMLDALIASRDRFEALFKKAAHHAIKDGSMAKLNASIAVKTLLGGLQWSLMWYRADLDTRKNSRKLLVEQMVSTLIDGIRVRP